MKATPVPAQPWRGALVLSIVLVAFGLRVYRLGEQSLWYDEAFSILLSGRSVSEIVAGTARDTMPPLYYLMLHGWGPSGGDFWARFPSAFFGTLCVPLTFAFAVRLLGPRVGALAAAIAALAPFQVYFGQEVRMYALLASLSLLAGYWFLRMLPETLRMNPRIPDGKPASIVRSRSWFVAAGGLAVYTHALGWLTMGTLGLWWLGTQRGRFWQNRGSAFAFLAVAGVFLPWTGILWEQARRVQGSFWTPPPTPVTPLASLSVFTFGPFLPGWLAPLGMTLVLFVFGLALAAVRSRAKDRRARWGISFSLVWLVTPLALAYFLSQWRPIYLERTLIAASFGLFAVLAWGLLHLRPRPVAWGLGMAGLALMVAALGRWYYDLAAAKPPLRTVAAAVGRDWQEGDAVVHTGDGSYLPFLVYLPGQPQALLQGDPEHLANTARAQSTLRVIGVQPVSAEQAAAGHRRVWLVLAPDHSPEFQRAAAENFGQGRTLLQECTFDGIVLRLYR